MTELLNSVFSIQLMETLMVFRIRKQDPQLLICANFAAHV